MSPVVSYQPGGFQKPALRRARVLPFRRGFGDAASDYAAIAAQLVPGSADQQIALGCSQNPSAPQCASALANALSTPYYTASQENQITSAIAAGNALGLPANVGAPPGTSIPAPAPAPTPPPVSVQQTAAPASIVATPNIQPIAAPAPTPVPAASPTVQAAPVDTSGGSTSLLSTTFLGFPLWVWGIAAVGGFLIFSQQGGRYGR